MIKECSKQWPLCMTPQAWPEPSYMTLPAWTEPNNTPQAWIEPNLNAENLKTAPHPRTKTSTQSWRSNVWKMRRLRDQFPRTRTQSVRGMLCLTVNTNFARRGPTTYSKGSVGYVSSQFRQPIGCWEEMRLHRRSKMLTHEMPLPIRTSEIANCPSAQCPHLTRNPHPACQNLHRKPYMRL